MSKPRSLAFQAGLISMLLLFTANIQAESLSSVEQRIGANTFYGLGYTGTSALLANIEAGLVWDLHQSMDNGHVVLRPNPFAISGTPYDGHATMVGGTMVCEQTANGGPGVAYGATLWSSNIATSFGSGGSFSISGNSLLWSLMVLGEVGINSSGTVGGAGAKTVNVVNSSWGATDNTGNTVINVIYDYLANHDGVTMVVSAGNSGEGAGTVGTPANGWNVIAVGATGGAGGTESVTSWSSGGPSGSFSLPGTRTKPDIVAPGLSISMPAYNVSNPGGFQQASGTSFAAPITAGCAGLLIDYGKTTSRSTDPRLVKSLLMNSAAKLPGWTQQKALQPGTGTTINYTPVDEFQGTGRVDLTGAYALYSASGGNGTGAGTVGKIGWDLNTVSQGTARSYFMSQMVPAGSTLTATLVWFMDRTVSGFNAASGNPYTSTDFSNDSFDDLDLYLYKADANGSAVGNAVAASISGWDPANPTAAATGLDSVEHLYLTAPSDGRYLLRVNWTQELFDYVGDPNTENYALSWSMASLRPGDSNRDGLVDGSDLAIWQQHYDPPGLNANTFAMGDWNMDSRIDGADLALWQQNYLVALPGETAPEPATLLLAAMGFAALGARRKRP